MAENGKLITIPEFRRTVEPGAFRSDQAVYAAVRNVPGFPVVRVGRRVYIDLDEWERFKASGGQALAGGKSPMPRIKRVGHRKGPDRIAITNRWAAGAICQRGWNPEYGDAESLRALRGHAGSFMFERFLEGAPAAVRRRWLDDPADEDERPPDSGRNVVPIAKS